MEAAVYDLEAQEAADGTVCTITPNHETRVYEVTVVFDRAIAIRLVLQRGARGAPRLKRRLQDRKSVV